MRKPNARVFLSALIVATAISCGAETTASQLSSPKSFGVEMDLRDDRVGQSDSLFVTYRRPPNESRHLALPPAIVLRQGAKDILLLNVRDKFPSEPFSEPGSGTLFVGLQEGKEHRFQVPSVSPGPYRVCAGFLLLSDQQVREEGEVCSDIEIVAN